ncbi:MAG: lipopolysaccharide heptosyltransferase II [Verrucomicrobia bacterium]|nr:lipopolysaccharide heptosyltransferase II [Verrucomicrobiota bacterium]
MSNPSEKIIVRSVNWLGDAVMSTSALQRLREARPKASITILSHEKLASLWKHQPFVDDVMVFTTSESPLQIGRRLRWGRFDAGLIFPNSPRSGLEMWFGRIPERIGYSRPWRNLFLTRTIAPRLKETRMHKRSISEIQRLVASQKAREAFPPSAHHVHQYVHLVAEAFGGNSTPLRPQIGVTNAQIEAFKSRFEIAQGSEPIFGLNPGAEYGLAKRWPKESYIEAAISLHKETGCRWFIFGGKGDIPLCNEIAEALCAAVPKDQVTNFVGRTSLCELAAALKLCRVVLTNDTGPMHLASAVGTRVVVPFGSTSADLTGPGLPEDPVTAAIYSDAPCSPCFLRECPIDFRCMRGISVSRIVAAALDAAGKNIK